ncbi:Phage holin family protein [Sphingomonas antarctica]|uniref:phage holin family protein n=1 Tax=Sphingomonas antarctica TaxID=2040274 RepID=UPI0039E8710D
MAGDGQEPRIPTRPSVPDLFARLITDGRAWAKAELALLKCRGESLVEALRTAVVLIVAAIMLATVASFALAIGAILWLATLVGPLWATVIVVVTLLALAGILGWLGVARIGRVFEDKS